MTKMLVTVRHYLSDIQKILFFLLSHVNSIDSNPYNLS